MCVTKGCPSGKLDGGRAPFGLSLESHSEAQATFDVLRCAVECDPKSRYSANTKCSNNSTCNLLMEEPMNKLSRRSMLRCSYGVAGAAATSLPAGNSQTRVKRPEPDRKSVVEGKRVDLGGRRLIQKR